MIFSYQISEDLLHIYNYISVECSKIVKLLQVLYMIRQFDGFFDQIFGGFFVIRTYCATPSLAVAAAH